MDIFDQRTTSNCDGALLFMKKFEKGKMYTSTMAQDVLCWCSVV
jgi:hypothetical protein